MLDSLEVDVVVAIDESVCRGYNKGSGRERVASSVVVLKPVITRRVL
jgi:hypothetical protein